MPWGSGATWDYGDAYMRENLIPLGLSSYPHTFKKDLEVEMQCSICCSEFEGKGRATLDCGHDFHLQCITGWLSQKGGRTCPLCRAEPGPKEKLHDINYNPTVTRMVRGVTQLMFAATNNDMVHLENLISIGENINAADGDGDTPLVYAVSNRHEEITKRLLIAGANITTIAKLVSAPATADGALAAAVSFYSPACLLRLMGDKVTLEGVNRAREIAVEKSYMDLAYILMVKRDVLIQRQSRCCLWPF